MEKQVEQFVSSFNGKFKLIDFGMNDDYQCNGLWLKLRTKSPANIKSFSTGAIHFEIRGDIVTVNKGFLNEMEHGLSIIAKCI